MRDGDDDEFAWLEDVEGELALRWVRIRNERAERDLFATPLYDTLRREILTILEADDRIPMPSRHGDTVLNFWTDESHRRGLLRRTSWDSYRAGDEEWETVLDVDALAAAENQSWVFRGSSTRRPDRTRMLIDLSPGGSDATVTREFDLEQRRFVSETDGGFFRPLGKGWLVWIDDDTVYVGNDFGPGTTTTSGYPRTIRRWSRGTPIDAAPVVFEGEEDDVAVHVAVGTLPGHRHHVFGRSLDFYRSRQWILRDDDLLEIAAPEDADLEVRERWVLIRPRSDWTVGDVTFGGGSLLVAELDRFLRDGGDVRCVFAPTDDAALADHVWTRNRLVLRVHENVRDRLLVAEPSRGWEVEPLAATPDVWSLAATAVDADECDDLWLLATDFVTPPTLYLAGLDQGPDLLRSTPPRFDAEGLTVAQHFATSADGTRVPYFLVSRHASDGPAPTLLAGYGGFEVANTAAYSGVMGRGWMSRGGVFALANIRGGGEYGPRWHQAGLRENRHRVYEDFEAVARDLIDRGVTTAPQLGIIGGSNGGLLVGNMYVRSPELFGAVVCQVPLLDMKRYTHLLAGASWMAEYGDPDDPDDWSFIRTFSPYHLVQGDTQYPPMLLTTSTRDDRVHPAHARKMAALLEALGHDVTYWENIEGGHGGAADAPQQAAMWALAYTFLDRHLRSRST